MGILPHLAVRKRVDKTVLTGKLAPIQNLWEQELAAQHSVCEDSGAEHAAFGVAYLGVPTPPPPCPNTGQVHEKCGNTGSVCLNKAARVA